MIRYIAALVLGASVLGLAACSGGASMMPPNTTQTVQGNPKPDGGYLPPNV